MLPSHLLPQGVVRKTTFLLHSSVVICQSKYKEMCCSAAVIQKLLGALLEATEAMNENICSTICLCVCVFA